MGKLIEKIDKPSDLRNFTIKALEALSYEIREYILEVVSANGGHLASNFGVVELTIALHYVYNTPEDLIIWDVGHQAYTHKILTGRREDFRKLRQYGGLSGFPSRTESKYDYFIAGHAGTSISVALGAALARDLLKKKNKIVAVIGDGSLTDGIAYEALNFLGDLGKSVTIILNDNEMSINKNVGAMSHYLNRLITNPTYNKLRVETVETLKRLQHLGAMAFNIAKGFEEGLKNLIVPGMIFEELGFRYLGPINGHNIESMIETFNLMKDQKEPMLIHVQTQKGHGYYHAEKDATSFHGLGPFDRNTGIIKKKKTKTFTEVFGETAIELGSRKEDLVAITAAMKSGTGLDGFARKFPDRFFDVGIAEQNAVCMAASMAASGLIPIVAIYSTFLQRAYDQVIHDVALQNLPVLFTIDRAGLVGEDGPTHHGCFDLAYLSAIPNLTILAPAVEKELIYMLNWAVDNIKSPIVIRFPRDQALDPPWLSINKSIPPLKSQILTEGEDIVLICVGAMLANGYEIAESLKLEGYKPALVNVRCVKPLDEEFFLKIASQYDKWIVIEEGSEIGGFGSILSTFLHRKKLINDLFIRGIPDKFVTYGTRKALFEDIRISNSMILEDLRNWLK
ncbi:MAG: 1-deoxy-D-xylulose-5-phosphate synthase [Candidatus Coatesbacteria bacterium]|nr:1-deoxy-D-xylulose-5-phosphate synthase [Candidatus Coatesbacteria bacterium]